MGSKGSNLPTCLGKSGAASRKTVCDLKLEGDWWLIAGQTARRGEMHINIEAWRSMGYTGHGRSLVPVKCKIGWEEEREGAGLGKERPPRAVQQACMPCRVVTFNPPLRGDQRRARWTSGGPEIECLGDPEVAFSPSLLPPPPSLLPLLLKWTLVEYAVKLWAYASAVRRDSRKQHRSSLYICPEFEITFQHLNPKARTTGITREGNQDTQTKEEPSVTGS